jgi:cyclase
MNKKIGLCIFMLGWLIPLSTAVISAATELEALPVSDNIFIVDGLPEAGNVVFLVTDAGVLVVDSGTDLEAGRKIVALIKKKTEQPILFIVLTHYHGDHTYGLQAFPAGAKIIAQENIVINQQRERNELESALAQFPGQIAAIKETLGRLDKKDEAQRQQEEGKLRETESRYARYQQIRITPPTVLFKDKTTVNLGGETVEIIFPGPAHTNDNCLVYFPGQEVIHMGDLVFRKLHPYIDWQAGSDTANWITQLEKVASWPLKKVIPGHGAVTGKSVLADQARYLTDLRAMVALELVKGTSLETMKKLAVPAQYARYGFLDMWPYAIGAVYHELGGK